MVIELQTELGLCSNASAQMIKTVSGGSSLPPYYAMAYIMKL